ncbi:MAG: LLM class flavin-dependent oxidoreductase [Acidimicrobiales bacterium]|nr:LLM class flavin-dependent oxidoreductase [Acidimicrobiales bacterium]
MVMSIARFNMIQPGLEPIEMSARYQAFVDMAEFAEQHGFSTITLEEHHGAENGWSCSPLAMACMVFARTKRIGVSISALLVPQHHPVRLAEDIAVADLLSGGGRLSIITGLGYRPSEYHLLDREWKRRGKLLDEALDVMLAAWTGEPFDYKGETVRVTPVPISKPHPQLLIGGTSPASARRAARLGLPFFPAAHLPDLEALYNDELAANGKTGLCIMPAPNTTLNFIHEDPDQAWAELGQYFFNEASVYAAWQPPSNKSAVKSAAGNPAELREEGIYRVLSPQEAIDELQGAGDFAFMTHHPLCGGMPIDEGWRSLQLYADSVLPALG